MMALRWPTKRLKKVDLPTFGRPTIATMFAIVVKNLVMFQPLILRRSIRINKMVFLLPEFYSKTKFGFLGPVIFFLDARRKILDFLVCLPSVFLLVAGASVKPQASLVPFFTLWKSPDFRETSF